MYIIQQCIVKVIQSTLQYHIQMEIDHQISKCLDTLDRQGLKYLRETLKNSNVFNQEIKEIIAIADRESMEKKKVRDKSPGKNKKNEQIEEEIVQQYETFIDDHQDPAKEKTKLGPNPTRPLPHEKVQPLKLQKFQDKIQQPIKPFAIRTSSKQGHRPSAEETKPVTATNAVKKVPIIQQKQQKAQKIQKIQKQSQMKQNDKKQIDQIVQRITNLPEQKLKKIGRFLSILQKSQKIEQQQFLNLKQTRPYLLKPDEAGQLNPSIMKSSAYSKGKKNQKATSLHNSIMRGSKKNSPYVGKCEDESAEKPEYQEHDKEIEEDNEISEEIPDIEQENRINQPKTMEMPSQMLRNQVEEPTRPEQKPIQDKNQVSMGKRTESSLIKKGSYLKNLPVANMKKPLDIEVTESHQVDTLELNQAMNNSKMVRLGKKKLGTNKVKLVLLRNRGHPSIIGLTCLQFYNTNGKLIPITLENIKSQSPKLLKLFNGIHNTINEQQMFTTVFKRDYQIQLEIPEKIGGVKIWNYNKSEIQSSKQTDWIQLYINDRLCWQGLIKKGSYNQLIDYSTEAPVEQGFDFAMMKKNSEGDGKVIEENSQGPSSSENIKLEGAGLSRLSLGKGKDKEAKENRKADWLENTLMEEKIKKIIEEDQKIEENQIKKTNIKTNRFSQLYNDHQKQPIKPQQQDERAYQTVIVNTNPHKQNSKQKQHPMPSPQKQTINIIERTTRTNSQKIDEEKDIFSSFGQILLKEKIKANQINAKVNEINEKVDKLKETYNSRKDADFGYASLLNNSKEQIPQANIKKVTPKVQQVVVKEKKNYQNQSLDDFMNDSLFQEPEPKDKKIQPNPRTTTSTKIQKQPTVQRNFTKKQESSKQTKPQNTKVDIDDFINELNDLVGSKQNKYQFGSQKDKKITIPELPKGNKLQLLLLSNWGDQQSIGLNKLQFFDSQGQRVFPSDVKCSANPSTISLVNKNVGYNTELSSQWKCNKKDSIKIDVIFSKKIEFSLMRVWNYIGDRVHSMTGIRKIEIILDGSLVFVGDVRKNAGTSRDQIFKSCENILFTNNVLIQKKIIQGDWLAQQLQNQRQQTVIFKKTIQNFMRPQTNSTVMSEKQLKFIQNKQGIKLPKRNCFEYDPPTFPSGYYLKLILHTTWGDRDFIGLNGLVIFDEKGQEISSDIKKITQFPAPLITHTGYQSDKRVLNNLFNGQNLTSNDQSIWLAPYLQDIDKLEKQAQNAILIEFDKICTFSAINIYNYGKTPKRGVREIEIHVDNYLIYRGYLRMANLETGQLLTTINFTKDTTILQKICYSGYNEDNQGQEVAFYNEGKPQKPMF